MFLRHTNIGLFILLTNIVLFIRLTNIGLFIFLTNIGLFLHLTNIALLILLTNYGLFLLLTNIALLIFLTNIGLFLLLKNIGLFSSEQTLVYFSFSQTNSCLFSYQTYCLAYLSHKHWFVLLLTNIALFIRPNWFAFSISQIKS